MPGLVSNRIFELMRLPKEVIFMAVKYFYCNLTVRKDASGLLCVSLAPHDLPGSVCGLMFMGKKLQLLRKISVALLGRV